MKISTLQSIIFVALLVFSFHLGQRTQVIYQQHNQLGNKITKINATLKRIARRMRAANVHPRIIKDLEDLGYTI